MKKFKKNFKINKIQLGIVFLVFSIAIGYAAVNTKLDFRGLAAFTKFKQDFSVYFSRAYLNDVGKVSIINESRNSITFSYSDIGRSDADLMYTVRNTSNKYYADVEIKCKARRNDGTKFEYDENNFTSYKFRMKPATSLTDSISILLPKTDTSVQSSTENKQVSLYNHVVSLSSGTEEDLNFDAQNPAGVYETTNTTSGRPVYFYHGLVEDNDVIFAEKCWKILRTTENGGVRLLFNGTANGNTCRAFGASFAIDSNDVIIKYNTTTQFPDNAYAGYMYGEIGADNYDDTHRNINDSMFKTKIDEWYERHLLNTSYEQYIKDDVYYNNRTVLTDFSNTSFNFQPGTNGFGENYASYESSATACYLTKRLSPSFNYYSKNDSFTVNESEFGNGALKYPIATLTADELVYAGINKTEGSVTIARTWIDTYGRNLFTMSPFIYFDNDRRAMSFIVKNVKGALKDSVGTISAGSDVYILPTITLNSDIEIVSGDGSNGSPFVLSSEDTYENTYTCTLTVNQIGKGYTDFNYNSLYDLEEGEEYCFEDECFYTISNDNNGNIKLMSKYNLYVGNYSNSASDIHTISQSDPLYGKQHYTAKGIDALGGYPRIGGILYSNSNNAYNSSNAKVFVDEYVEYLKELTGINLTGSLATKEELTKLGCSNTCTTARYEWVTGITYWLMTPGSNSKQVYLVGADGYFGVSSFSATNKDQRGVRPVISVHVEKPDTYPKTWDDNGVFSEYYDQAYDKLKDMTPSEKVGQLLMMSYNEDNPNDAFIAIQDYHVGGVLFFADAFKNKTVAQVQAMTSNLQTQAKTSLMTAVDEEGGIVTRIARNTNLVGNELVNYPNLFKKYGSASNSYNAFKAPMDLYIDSGKNFDLIKQDTKVKSVVLKRLGINMNFAPVVDVADSGSFIYQRTLGQGTEATGNFAKTVVNASKGTGVSYSLKHFPGYGNNADTHTSSSIDQTSIEELWNTHVGPFLAGINAGAEAVMISHNIVSALDKEYPSSLSKPVHDLLFNDLHFTGLSITDDLSMDAVGDKYSKQYLKAFKAGNHVMLTNKSYAAAHSELLEAVNNGEITEEELNQRVFKVLAWKYYNGVLKD